MKKQHICLITKIDVLLFWLYQREPPAMPGGEKSFSGRQRNKKNPSIEQKWFADDTSTIERDSNWQFRAVSSTEMLE